MFPFCGAKSEKDIGKKLVGKVRRYRLHRHGATVTVEGRLLAFYRYGHEPDGLMPPAAGRVELIALFLTRAGRFLVYYIVSYPETEDIAGRQEYVHVLESLAAVETFLAAMHYPNRADFAVTLIADAAGAGGDASGGQGEPFCKKVPPGPPSKTLQGSGGEAGHVKSPS